MEPPVTIVILAAGLGTRMKSRRAKVLHRAGGLTLVEHVVKTALELTPAFNVYAVVGNQAEQVQEALGGYDISYVLQAEQRGTGHALMACREALSARQGLLVILYGDCPLLAAHTLSRLVEHQKRSYAAATVITTLLDDPSGYGRVITDQEGRIRAIVEQKAATTDQLEVREVNSGIYCFRAELLWRHLDEIRPNNPAREYYLTDIVEIFHRHGHFVETLRLEDPTEVLGINTRVELAAVDREFRDRKVRQLMIEGVTIERPETVTIDAGVCVGVDTVIEPFARLLGRTVIGEDCHVGSASIIRDSCLASGVEVGPFTIINASRVDSGARIGPYARLRLENHVEAGAQVGNFVELKKTHLGPRAQSMHLAYLGDSSIGADVNIGAGTITCNYDGRTKNRTTIGEGAFVGSNATLVAPVEVGEGSYVAAGSVITEAVPADALALGRSRQVVKPEWAKRRRERG